MAPAKSYAVDHPDVVAGADLILKECGRLRSGESVAIVCDTETRAMGRLLEGRARLITPAVRLVEIAPLSMHGQDPPAEAAQAMKEAALCLGITSKSMAHSRARLDAAAAGGRYLSLPDFSLELLASPSLRADYRACAGRAAKVASRFTAGKSVRVTAPAGTDVSMRIDGRTGNCCPGFVERGGELGSPPDVESNVSPIEDSAEGVVVVDGSIPYPGLGLVDSPVRLEVAGGKIVAMDGEDKALLGRLKRLFESAGSEKAYVLAECGVGLNERASLTGVMLTDEGAAGTMHFGFGSNYTVGGKNQVSFHLDVVFRSPTLAVDGAPVLENGRYLL
ncbi:MAG: hypothetical protein HY553_00420 [Elusimicrobia bacterium]|nr:hypothetical protein [Elusimicrobiota bacterium]